MRGDAHARAVEHADHVTHKAITFLPDEFADWRAARPDVLKMVTAKAGMTMAGLAKTSPLNPDAESQLRLLNNLYPAGEPTPGQRLNIVQ